MSAGDKAVAVALDGKELRRRALSLCAANAFDYALQFLLPVVLVRCLDSAAFGQYRLLWLAAGTAMAVVTHAMSGSLYYFLPRSEGATKRLYVNHTLLFLAVAGLMAVVAVISAQPSMPATLHDLVQHGAIGPAFALACGVAPPL